MFNEDDVRQIVDLGFTDDEAKAALVANNYSLNSAIEWILAGHNSSGGFSGNHRNRPRRRRGNLIASLSYFVLLIVMIIRCVRISGIIVFPRDASRFECIHNTASTFRGIYLYINI